MALAHRVDNWIRLVNQAANKSKLTRIQLISDAVFAATESSADGLRQMILFAQFMLSNGVSKSLPVRGAITHGSFEWGRLTYGQAVILCHELEAKQNWIGITCTNELPHLNSFWGINSLICYPSPLKSNRVRLFPVVAWDVPEYSQLVKLLTSNGLTAKDELLTWPWAEKVTHTAEFGIYRKILQESGADCSRFHGTLPIEVIQMNVRPKRD